MDHGILRLDHNQLLEVHEGKTGISNQIGTFTSIQVSVKKVLIKIDRDRKVSDCLFEHTQACIASSTGQVVLGVGLLGLLDDSFQVSDRIVEEMEGEIDKAAQVEHLIVFRRVLKALIEVTLGIFKHFSLCFRFDRLVEGISDNGDCSK